MSVKGGAVVDTDSGMEKIIDLLQIVKLFYIFAALYCSVVKKSIIMYN